MGTITAGDRSGSMAQERPSVDDWILGLLQTRRPYTLDDLADSLPEVNWAQLFLAVDRLSRSGSIILWKQQGGDYLVSLKEAADASKVQTRYAS